MIVAPVVAALLRFASRSSRQRNEGSSWKPTGIRGAARDAAGTAAARKSRQPRMRRARVIWARARRASRPTISRLPDGRAATNTALTAVLLVARRAPHALDLAPALLRREALLDRPAMRPRRPPRPPDAERVAQRRDQPRDGQLAIPELAALVLGHRADRRAGAREHALLLRVRQGRRRLDV